MNPALWLVIIILIILVVWWLMSRTAETEKLDFEVHEHHEEHGEREAVRAGAALDVGVAKPDDLTVLEGIGPKVNSVLQAAGIHTYAQLASAEVEQLKDLLAAGGLNWLDPSTWPEQAGLLAEGKLDEFKRLTETLKGGRRVH